MVISMAMETTCLLRKSNPAKMPPLLLSKQLNIIKTQEVFRKPFLGGRGRRDALVDNFPKVNNKYCALIEENYSPARSVTWRESEEARLIRKFTAPPSGRQTKFSVTPCPTSDYPAMQCRAFYRENKETHLIQ